MGSAVGAGCSQGLPVGVGEEVGGAGLASRAFWAVDLKGPSGNRCTARAAATWSSQFSNICETAADCRVSGSVAAQARAASGSEYG